MRFLQAKSKMKVIVTKGVYIPFSGAQFLPSHLGEPGMKLQSVERVQAYWLHALIPGPGALHSYNLQYLVAVWGQ